MKKIFEKNGSIPGIITSAIYIGAFRDSRLVRNGELAIMLRTDN